MAHSTNPTGKELETLSRKNPTSGAILIPLGDRPRKKNAEVMKPKGIHEDYINDALNGRPCRAKVIDLDEYRWMRMFDEL